MTGALLTIATIGYDFNRRDSSINGDLIDASGMEGRRPRPRKASGNAVWQHCFSLVPGKAAGCYRVSRAAR